LHEIEGRKWNGDGRGPALLRNTRFGCPNAIPPRVAIPRIALSSLLFGNQRIALCAQSQQLEAASQSRFILYFMPVYPGAQISRLHSKSTLPLKACNGLLSTVIPANLRSSARLKVLRPTRG